MYICIYIKEKNCLTHCSINEQLLGQEASNFEHTFLKDNEHENISIGKH